MPKGQRKNNSKLNLFSIALLLIQFILLKIGEALLLLTKIIFRIAKGGFLRTQRALDEVAYWRPSVSEAKLKASRRTLALASKRVRFPTIALYHPHRGRPRKSWLIPYYLNKFRIYFKRVPKKTKIIGTSFGIFVFLFLYTSFILNAAYQLPSPDRLISPTQPLTTQIYDRNGKLLYRLYEGRNRSLVQLSELPKYLIDATVAIEDKNFYKHGGIDLEAIARAFIHNSTNGSQEGASTITQQLIKNALLTPEKTYGRKIKEIILAIWAESKYSKREILQMYFNEAPYGGPTWGIKAAANTYFGKEPKDLTLAESAFLAGLPASPTEFSPYGSHPELGIEREKQVLQRMVEEKLISKEEQQEALAQRLDFNPPQDNIRAPHFVFYIKDILSQIYGPRVISQGGLKIVTSLDLDLQLKVEKIVSDEVANLGSLNVQNGAAMVTDPKTGEILAMVGSKDYYNPKFGNFNATIALRQPGSSIKVVTYATALKQGFSPGNTILDSPTTFKDGTNSYSPVNYDGGFHGPVSIRAALGSSLNIPAVKMLATIGVDKMIQTARDLGITTFGPADAGSQRFGLSLTLGGGEVRMIEMMGAYGTLSQNGKFIKPTGILKVTDSSGNVLEEYQDGAKQSLSPQVAYILSSILSDNNARSIAFGVNSLLNIPGQTVAVKTGTSDNKRDNWTFGYTPDFVVGVWVGNNDNSPMDPHLTSGITGAAPIWRKITDLMLENHPSTAFVKPDGVTLASVDGRRDLVISGNQPKGLVRVRTEEDEHSSTGYKTIFSDAFSSYATPSASRPAEQATINTGATN